PIMILPFVLWGAIRFGVRGASAVTFIVSATAIFTTVMGYGPFYHETLVENAVKLHIYVGIIGVSGLILATTTTQRLAAEMDVIKAIRALDDLLSIASHELKTPVTSIKLQLHLAQKVTRQTPPPVDAITRLDKSLVMTNRQIDRMTA